MSEDLVLVEPPDIAHTGRSRRGPRSCCRG